MGILPGQMAKSGRPYSYIEFIVGQQRLKIRSGIVSDRLVCRVDLFATFGRVSLVTGILFLL